MTILLILTALVATLCVSYAATPFVKRRAFNLPFLAIALPASLLMAIVSAPTLWLAILSGYPDDSFFDLGFFGGLGVLAISGTLITLFAFILIWKSRKMLAFASKRRLSGWLILAFDCVLGLALFGTLHALTCLLYTSPSPRDLSTSRMPSSA